MDLWVVAAAAGAGYIAKNLPNFSVDKKESLCGPSLKYSYDLQPESRNFLQQLRDKTCPLRKLAQKTVQDDAFLDSENHSEVKLSEIDRSISRDREASVVSVNGDYSEKTGILEGYNKGFISGFSAGESQQFGDGENKNLSRIDRGKMVRNRRCRVHSTRPLSSTGSCMDNMEHSWSCMDSMEHSSCLHSSMSTVRPVLVTDATWEEARRDSKSSSPPMKKFESSEEFGKPEKSSSSLQQSGSGDGVAFVRSSCSQGAETVLLFISGMTVGILTATTSWKNEVDRLNMQLNQMQNLVQDLHEELDMKEMLMVKELDDESDPPPGEEDTPLSMEEPVSSPSKVNEFDGVKANDNRKAENLELLSRIEAELQAELEMLEQNIKTSELDRISSVVELDPVFEPEIVRGELKATMVKDDASESGSRTTGTTRDCSKPANYVVSPQELSLRLHELIESRLETRIKELEIALSHRENRVGVQHQHSIVSARRFSYSGTESSSTHHSPTCICDEHDKREDEPSTGNSCCNDGESGTNRTQNGDHDSIFHHGVITGEDRSPNLVQDMQRLTSLMSNEDSMSEDEGSDESELLLIKQIVERRRSGSSFNFKID